MSCMKHELDPMKGRLFEAAKMSNVKRIASGYGSEPLMVGAEINDEEWEKQYGRRPEP